MGRKLISIILIVWIFLMMPIAVFAQEFDPGRAGSISVTLLDQGRKKPIAGAELSLYHVATVERNGNNR